MSKILKAERIPGGLAFVVELSPAVMGTRPAKVMRDEPDENGRMFDYSDKEFVQFPIVEAVVKDYIISAEDDDAALVALQAQVSRDVALLSPEVVSSMANKRPDTLAASAAGRIAAKKEAEQRAKADVAVEEVARG